jgi:hypothetical protein
MKQVLDYVNSLKKIKLNQRKIQSFGIPVRAPLLWVGG